MRTFGENVKRRREALNMDKATLGEIVGVSRHTIRAYEQNARYPNILIASSLAKALQCTIDDLLK